MTSVSETAGATVTAVQSVLTLLNTYLACGSYLCPTSLDYETAASMEWDYIIVGSGTAGSAVAYELSKYNVKVLLIEEGLCPPIESNFPGYFTVEPKSWLDRNYTLTNDSYTCQNQQPDAGATAGKMLGGTGSLEHMLHIRTPDEDFVSWCEAAGDSSWCGEDLQRVFAKTEKVIDTELLKDTTIVHGTTGPIQLKRQPSCYNDIIFEGLEQMGIPQVNDTLASGANYACHPTLAIGCDGLRQSGNVGFLSKLVNSTTVKVLTGARVEKVLFNGTAATGVEYTNSGTTYTVSADIVILSAGAFGTAQLLMLSGIGNATHLSEKGITSVVDNSDVGQNLMDHQTTCFAIAMNNSAISASTSPHEFPVPMMTAYAALNSSQTYPDQQTIFLNFPPQSSGFLQLCYHVFKYKSEICDRIYNDYNAYSNLLFGVYNLLHPVSKGSCTLKSSSMDDQLNINLGMLSNKSDLYKSATLLYNMSQILNTTAFTDVNAKLVDLGLCEGSTGYEFWECYTVAMSSTMWHYSGTCAIGKVVDSSLNVYGTTNLKVADASAMPSLVSGNIAAATRAIGTKAAEIIVAEKNLTLSTTTTSSGTCSSLTPSPIKLSCC